MADTLNFGPEWLRALSDGNSVTSPPPSPAGIPTYTEPKYQYGRAEMLALFVPNSKAPEKLKEFTAIFVDKAMHPLAFVPPSEEEQRILSGSLNSSAVLRMAGRGGSAPRGARGVSTVDRGRGRGRGRGDGYFPRYDDEGYGRGGRLRSGSEPWEEGQARPSFDARFASGRSFDEETEQPARKDFSRSMSSDNWREAKKEGGGVVASVVPEKTEEEGGDWRSAGPKGKWTGGRGSWRDSQDRAGFERDFNDRGRYDDFRQPYGGRYDRTKHTDLPEWSTADADEDIGTFDSSGAFMSLREAQEFEFKEYEKKKDKRGPVDEKGDSESDQANKLEEKKLADKPKKVTQDHSKEIEKKANHSAEAKQGSPPVQDGLSKKKKVPTATLR